MKTIVCKNYKIHYEKRKSHFDGREYISGSAEYIGKEYRLTNTFFTYVRKGYRF